MKILIDTENVTEQDKKLLKMFIFDEEEVKEKPKPKRTRKTKKVEEEVNKQETEEVQQVQEVEQTEKVQKVEEEVKEVEQTEKVEEMVTINTVHELAELLRGFIERYNYDVTKDFVLLTKEIMENLATNVVNGTRTLAEVDEKLKQNLLKENN